MKDETRKMQALRKARAQWQQEAKNPAGSRRQKMALDMIETLDLEIMKEEQHPSDHIPGHTKIVNTRTGETLYTVNRAFTDPQQIRNEIRQAHLTNQIPLNDLKMYTTYTSGITREYFIPTMPDPRGQ